jgi:hypothetical protein
MIKIDIDNEISPNAVTLNFHYGLDIKNLLDFESEDELKENIITYLKEVVHDTVWSVLCTLDEHKVDTIYEISEVTEFFTPKYTDPIYVQDTKSDEPKLLGYRGVSEEESDLLFHLKVNRDLSVSDKNKLTVCLND